MVRVAARRSIPRGRLSRAFWTDDLKRHDIPGDENVCMDLDSQSQIIFKDALGNALPFGVVSSVPLAGDIQNKNLELFCDGEASAGAVWRLRLLRDVAPGEDLELWFAEDVLARLDMPFLTPRNIKGRKNYVCHECGVQFEQPNPLKIHLFLSCKPFSVRKFWKRVVQKLYEDSTPLNLSVNRFMSRNTELTFDRPRSHENSTTSPENNSISSRCYSEPPYSAFRPYNQVGSNLFSHFNNNSPLNSFLNQHFSLPHLGIVHPNYSIEKSTFWDTIDRRVNAVSKSFENVSVTNAAEIESIATNWGKSKEGHLCLYCGKVYSRKYGLKIHIRTHTGYKPLQCKYCMRPFGDPSNLNKHVRLHAQSETPYSCQLCGKMLVRKRDLERHLRSRHADDEDVKEMAGFIRDSPSPP